MVLAILLGGCSCLFPPTEDGLRTNYEQDAIYILQQDVAMMDTGVIWGTLRNPRYWASKDHLFDKSNPVLYAGSKIQFKRINYEYNIEMGRMYDPVGIILSPPYKGKTLHMSFISQKSEVRNPKESAYGTYVDSQFLVKDVEQ